VFSGGAAANFVQDTDFFEFFVFLSSSRWIMEYYV
jgi:hypothetical protein